MFSRLTTCLTKMTTPPAQQHQHKKSYPLFARPPSAPTLCLATPPSTRYLKQTGLGKHRCALLFGRVSPSTNGVKVEAMYEPPQQQPQRQEGGSSSSSSTYDPSALVEAARVAVAAATLEDGGSGECEAEGAAAAAAADVARAVRVAGLLGLRLVGWCLSHDKVKRIRDGRGMGNGGGGGGVYS